MKDTNMNNSVFLSVIIPCYNEEENLKRGVLGEVFRFLKKTDFSWEVIVSDDGSSDKSKEIIRKEIENLGEFRLLENSHGGKPSALRYGVEKAMGENILFSDMDQSTPVEELRKFLPYIDAYEIVIGSRGLKREDFPIYRKIGSALFSTFRRILILPEISDTQCGFKLFKADLLKKAFPRLEYFRRKQRVMGWRVTSFDVELLHILKKMGCKIKEVKVIWNDKDTSTGKGGAAQKYIRESKEMFTQILRVKLNDLRGFYKNV